MNILIPYHWLLDHLDTKASPQDLQKDLSLCGPSVERIHQVEGEPVFDIETTTNRVDATSVRGIAREAATILPEFNIEASLKPLQLPTIDNTSPLGIEITNNDKLCHRIVAIKLTNVSLGPSPEWLQKRLRQVGQRPLNNAVDITNYLMWEIGHPVHAFDYDRLTHKKILVREAKKGEKLTTLDDKTHTLNGGEVVFDDGTGEIIDLPGIMGTKNTVVTNNTTNVLLWIESVDAVKIRQASMGLAIRSQAAVLNEKGVDPNLALDALKRGVQLFIDITKAQVGSNITDIYPHPQTLQTASVTQNQIDTYLGISIKPERIQRILENLGCTVKALKDTKHNTLYEITPPSWRANDLIIPQDYIEEVARIYGYHNLPSVVMATPIPNNPPPENFHLEYQIKQWLSGWGAQEIYTYSMVSEKLAKASGSPLFDHLKIKNPLSDEWVYLRRSLVPSLLEVLEQNPTKRTTVYELQNVYLQKGANLPEEQLQLALVTNQDYPHLKGLLDALMAKLYITDYSINPDTNEVLVGKQGIGVVTGQSVWLKMSALQALNHTHPLKLTESAYPPIIEDLTLTLPPKTHLGPMLESIKSTDQLIEAVMVKDRYQQNYTFTVIYRSSTGPLTDKAIAPIRKHIVKEMEKTYAAKLVGNLS